MKIKMLKDKTWSINYKPVKLSKGAIYSVPKDFKLEVAMAIVESNSATYFTEEELKETKITIPSENTAIQSSNEAKESNEFFPKKRGRKPKN